MLSLCEPLGRLRDAAPDGILPAGDDLGAARSTTLVLHDGELHPRRRTDERIRNALATAFPGP